MLDVRPYLASADAPHIQAYASATQLLWPDLTSIGVAFPSGSTYTCRVLALRPYLSIDELASERGPYRTGIDRQELDSETIELTLVQ